MLTVYGIETPDGMCLTLFANSVQLEQCLPFTVLKPPRLNIPLTGRLEVGTVLTVYGIETSEDLRSLKNNFGSVGTVLTVYGIETFCVFFD